MAGSVGKEDDSEFLKTGYAETGQNITCSYKHHASSSHASSNDESNKENDSQWAAIERLPVFRQLRTSLLDHRHLKESGKDGKRVVDVTKIGAIERCLFIENLVKEIDKDNRRLLHKLKERIERVGLELPTVEVRYEDLYVEADCEVVQGKALPSIWNTLKNTVCAMTRATCCKSQTHKSTILNGVTGIVKPSRLTLLLGPPGCGKSTLLQALAGKLNSSLEVKGDISYNGYNFNEFVPQKTSAYISQYDIHISEMTVRETLDFSARCQGIGDRGDVLKEVIRREKQAKIIPEPDMDIYMKAISLEGNKRTLQTDYIIKILGLDICADTIVGDAMNRGISGGQKKRLTTGEMIIGPRKVLFMDEISTGLDSSTTFQVVTYLQQLSHIADCTILVSLLQPAPETFDLFDDIILMAEGKIVYHGPRSKVLEFFEQCGFRCPPRKGIADFLQEVISIKDQAKYWYHKDQPHQYIPVEKLATIFKASFIGMDLEQELSNSFTKSDSSKNALAFKTYSRRKWELFKACMAREWLLMKRNAFIHVFKSVQLVVTAIVTMTVFIRTQMAIDLVNGNYYMGSLFYSLVRLACNGIVEISMTGARIAVFYKQRDSCYYPAWAFSIPAIILKIPFSFLDATLWTTLTYYVIGYSPEPERFLRQLFLLFLVHQVSISMFRLIASAIRDPSVASTCSNLSLVFIFLFGGFVIPKPSLSAWLEWGFWLSPLTYGQIGISINEFLAPRWQKVSFSNANIGQQVLEKRGLNFSEYYYWISIGALLGFWMVFNVGFTLALNCLDSPGRSETMISQERLSNLKREIELSNATKEENSSTNEERKGTILPFEPISISFEDVQYFVDTPKRLQLLQDITGAFRPGILAALMGVSGAGKTTLMDVLSGRKTGGIIKGDIRVGGYPKVQSTYARISGYCEQSDIHSPNITVGESVIYSAWLRLPAQIDRDTRMSFAAEVLQMIELDGIQDALVGVPGVSGISTEQRKRLTIAVELVSNPSILFMDEPTSGLDARAAAIILRVVKNIVRTRRTVVCTIHQPSIDIFEAFDELILLKRGGEIIYSGQLGQNSSKLIKYFEAIPGVPKCKENNNPATWMLEVTSPSAEAQLGLDFSKLYKESNLFWDTKELVQELKSPSQGSKELQFSNNFRHNGWVQFKACLWKQHLSYWRNPKFNLARLMHVIVCSLLLGALLWQKGQKIDHDQDFLNILGAISIFVQFVGVSNCSSILPVIAIERAVTYRERFAQMYSSWAYSFSQVIIEIPYSLLQAVLFLTITYPAVNFQWSIYKVFWYFYTTFCTLLYFSYFGMLLASLTPTYQMAAILAAFSYTMMNLFSGFLIPGPKIPKWWAWCYWICPTSWSLKGLLTSQYGDIETEITAYGEYRPVNYLLQSYYGYNYDDLGSIATVLLAFPLIFALGFAYAMAKLNFQRR